MQTLIQDSKISLLSLGRRPAQGKMMRMTCPIFACVSCPDLMVLHQTVSLELESYERVHANRSAPQVLGHLESQLLELRIEIRITALSQ